MSGHPTFVLMPTTTSDADTSLAQDPPLFNKERENPWSPNFLLYTQPGILHPGNLIFGIRDEYFPVIHPPGPICRTTCPLVPLPESSLRGRKGLGPVPVTFSEDSTCANVDQASNLNRFQPVVSINVPSDSGHQYAPFGTSFDSSKSSKLPDVSCSPVHFPTAGKGTATRASRPSRKAPGVLAASKSPHSCSVCGKTYAQRQGVRRHHRETHKARLCTYCYSFEWGRPYRLRMHIKKRHPDVNADAAVNEAMRQRRTTKVITRHINLTSGFTSNP
ncbi:hypothetical protein F5148DRAFT_1225801 [Russula earlei]|uniref:Uncharacterized protein n=1 Tax=Russula earlei TaxID=71964 RepID=A0ACC0U1R6_9AGAM|nr:hypothetical protein F5148DRAFT_1225801 [Russula earlei]